MKILLSAIALAMLAGCVSADGPSAQRTADDLRKPMYFQTEQLLPFTFPEIQMALIKQQRLCGTAPQFSMNEGQTSYGTITQKNDPTDGWDKTILVDLTWLESTWRQETRVKTEVYSQYSGSEVDERIRQIYAAINHPDICPGAEDPGAKDSGPEQQAS